jgi:hypothetical protein
MAVRFSIGHRLGGTDHVSLSVPGARAALDSLLTELETSDDEHYQVFVINAADAAITILDNGLFVYSPPADAPVPTNLYYKPATRDAALDILVRHVRLAPDAWLPRFAPEPPTGGTSFLPARETSAFPLHEAAYRGDLELVKQLVEDGYAVNQRDADGATPLMHAVVEGHYQVCRYLIDHGADVSVRDNDGWDLLRLATSYPEIVQLVQAASSSGSDQDDTRASAGGGR